MHSLDCPSSLASSIFSPPTSLILGVNLLSLTFSKVRKWIYMHQIYISGNAKQYFPSQGPKHRRWWCSEMLPGQQVAFEAEELRRQGNQEDGENVGEPWTSWKKRSCVCIHRWCLHLMYSFRISKSLEGTKKLGELPSLFCWSTTNIEAHGKMLVMCGSCRFTSQISHVEGSSRPNCLKINEIDKYAIMYTLNSSILMRPVHAVYRFSNRIKVNPRARS